MEPADLANRPLAELLVELHAARATGTLHLERARTTKQLGFADGFLVAAESSLPREALIARLEDAGEIGAEAATRARSLAKERRSSEAAALAATKAVEPKRLIAAMRERIAACALDAFAWPDGSARFEPGTAANAAEARALRADPLALALRGIARTWTPERIALGLHADRARHASAAPAFGEALRRLCDDEVAVLQLERVLDGRRTLETVVGLVFREPLALAGLWVAHRVGLVALADAPADDAAPRAGAGAAGDEAPPEIEIEVVGAADSAAARGAARARAATAASASRADGASPEAEEMRKRVLDLYERIESGDHYALLGVPADANAATIKKAYFKAAKQFHPDKLARLGLGDVKAQAAEVFAALAEANEVLSDPKRRKQYDDAVASGGSDDQVDVALLAQAESFFRKGEVLVKMGDFRGAVELLERAAKLWPSEPAYHALLGFALFKRNPPDLDAARSSLEVAIGIAPEDARAHMWLGLVLRAQGHVNDANSHVAKARKLDPSVS